MRFQAEQNFQKPNLTFQRFDFLWYFFVCDNNVKGWTTRLLDVIAFLTDKPNCLTSEIKTTKQGPKYLWYEYDQ